jgi:hypothetical protein
MQTSGNQFISSIKYIYSTFALLCRKIIFVIPPLWTNMFKWVLAAGNSSKYFLKFSLNLQKTPYVWYKGQQVKAIKGNRAVYSKNQETYKYTGKNAELFSVKVVFFH